MPANANALLRNPLSNNGMKSSQKAWAPTPIFFLAVALVSATSSAFVNLATPRATPQRHTPMLLRSSTNHDHDLYIYSIDGTLASMTDYKSKIAIRAALEVWPSLHSVLDELDMKPFEDNAACIDDYSWLIQKLGALSSITQQGDSPDEMLGCDEVLLARLLLEEQLLDDGRSSGRGGKYGGKFHPAKSTTTSVGGGKPKVGSRPLTVGEILANWSELRFVTHNKYPFLKESQGKVNMSDPLPEIRRVLCELYSQADTETTKLWYPFASDILGNKNTNNVLLIGNEASLGLVLSSLEQLLGETMKVTVTDSIRAWKEIKQQQVEDGHSLLIVVPDTATEEPQSDLIQRIIRSAASEQDNVNRNIYVAHGSLDVLQKCKCLLGDDPPILSNGLRKCIVANDTSKTSATLFLPAWSNVHPTQLNECEMDPWLNIATEELLEELTSAVIV
jgi:hypothetical protein